MDNASAAGLKKFRCLHLYSQGGFHEEGYIIGNTDALIALRDAIDQVLKQEPTEGRDEQIVLVGSHMPSSHAPNVELMDGWDAENHDSIFASDGEGYDLYVIKLDNNKKWNDIAMPYTEENWGKEMREEAVWPHKLVYKQKA